MTVLQPRYPIPKSEISHNPKDKTINMKFELRNKRYNFLTNIMRADNKEQEWYEKDICDLINMKDVRIKSLEKQLSDIIAETQHTKLFAVKQQNKLLREKVEELEKENVILNNTIESLQNELFHQFEKDAEG